MIGKCHCGRVVFEVREGRSYNYFCGVCGIHTHFYNTYDDPPDYKYNLACGEDVDLASLEIIHIDGKSF